MREFIPPFRIGKKQQRAVLDSSGHELVVFPKGREEYAQEYVNFLNIGCRELRVFNCDDLSDSFKKSIDSIKDTLNR